MKDENLNYAKIDRLEGRSRPFSKKFYKNFFYKMQSFPHPGYRPGTVDKSKGRGKIVSIKGNGVF